MQSLKKKKNEKTNSFLKLYDTSSTSPSLSLWDSLMIILHKKNIKTQFKKFTQLATGKYNT